MELKAFIGKVVVHAVSKERYILKEITAPYITVVAEHPSANGQHPQYRWETINGDPISNGTLAFEDAALLAPFKAAYAAHSHSKEGYWEDYGYWMRKG